ncbi:alanine racemase [Novosphingobium album (ex Liu et al. 2023)]|uniref:alanine racemase n=1 Tax=Novosphingobium album (ex Liu et al. 2023) TaxID=3031130 RepID=A0ABT5WPE4_9SPHN|nr:alanine racemase [Novosphingobium album (ex Liu et al. 2023)]MDE8651921.1 alanine racemase [Novosphingobium album (ex Liu et al. 2023)]
MLPEPSAALRLAVDTQALQANWTVLDRLSGGARAGAAVKANGYGLGAVMVADALQAAGCGAFFVAHWCEVGELLGHVPADAISVLHGPLTGADAAYARATGARPVINSLAQARRWLAAGGGRCDLMVDTGINRLGVPMADLGDAAIAALDIDILLSHLASADEDVPLNAVQLGRWNAARGQVRHARASLASSAGIVLGPEYHGDLTRPGLSLYGGVPRPELAGAIRQVARPQAAIMQARQVQAGDGIGYNQIFVAERAMRIGTIALGYADGYLRCWSGTGGVIADGQRLPVLGRVSMDMTVIDLSAAPDLREGDWVEIEYALPEAAARSGLSQYELLTVLGRRFGRWTG